MKNIFVIAIFCVLPLMAFEVDLSNNSLEENVLYGFMYLMNNGALAGNQQEEMSAEIQTFLQRYKEQEEESKKDSIFYKDKDNEENETISGPAQDPHSIRPAVTRTQSSPISSLREAVVGYERRPSLPAEFLEAELEKEMDQLFGLKKNRRGQTTLKPSKFMPERIAMPKDARGIASEVEAVKKKAAKKVAEKEERMGLLHHGYQPEAMKNQKGGEKKGQLHTAELEKAINTAPAKTVPAKAVESDRFKKTIGFEV